MAILVYMYAMYVRACDSRLIPATLPALCGDEKLTIGLLSGGQSDTGNKCCCTATLVPLVYL